MTRRLLLEAAAADIDAIVDYLTREAGPRIALKYALDLDWQLELITDFPGIGSPRPELGPLCRSTLVSPYVVIYDHDASQDSVAVLRVLHGRRNIAPNLIRR
jgi:plasmid stabilization system protein ParE